MQFELFVAWRYLLARRKQAVVSFVSLISTLGVTAGVAALIVALSLNSGFQEEFQRRILRATSHVNLIRLGNLAILDYEQLADRLSEVEGVAGITPTVYAQALLMVGDLNRQQPAILRGVDPQRGAIVEDLFASIVEGELGEFARLEPFPSIVLGKDLAQQLGVLVGENVRAVGLQGELSPLGRMPRVRTFRVVAVFDSGLWDYDANWALVPLAAAQGFSGLSPFEASALEFRIEDIHQAEAVASRLREAAGPGYATRSWIDLNRPLFSALQLEKLALFIAISLIVMVASLNIVSTLTLMVMEKSQDIAIISAMGGGTGTLVKIFMLQGLAIGVVGTLTGDLLGCSLVWYFDTYRVFPLEPQIYSIPFVPFRLNWAEVALVSLVAVLVSFLATLYPARAASRLDPVEVFRHV